MKNMIQSMTGYGRSAFSHNDQKFLVEIRSVNGKTPEVSVKSQLIPRERENEVRQLVAKRTVRGTIDIYISNETQNGNLPKTINREQFVSYYNQIKDIYLSLGKEDKAENLTGAILRLPDVVEISKPDEKESWPHIIAAIENAVEELLIYRKNEGERLREDIMTRLSMIESYLFEVEKFEKGRIEIIRERILKRAEELGVVHSSERLEQEMIYYIEKLDITEEKVRLAQHCNYFRETIGKEEYPGRKLGFIAQEMGREINTLGSKANNVDIQKIVVNMKDELEKIKEQILNIL